MLSGPYDGMTVNERLFSAGLMNAFDEAAGRRDCDVLIAILCQVAVVDPYAVATAVLAASHR
jgi:hypothetical protein